MAYINYSISTRGQKTRKVKHKLSCGPMVKKQWFHDRAFTTQDFWLSQEYDDLDCCLLGYETMEFGRRLPSESMLPM
jgi:hypothetical protein